MKFSERLFSSPTTGNRMEVEPLILKPADRSISGIVVDEQDRPVSKASVSLLRAGPAVAPCNDG